MTVGDCPLLGRLVRFRKHRDSPVPLGRGFADVWSTHRLTPRAVIFKIFGAGDGIRTRDIDLGKVALYQLSYSRLRVENVTISYCRAKPPEMSNRLPAQQNAL